MPRRKLTDSERNQVIGMIRAGRNQIEVAAEFDVSQSVISRLFSRYTETGSVSERPRSGRPRKTNAAQDRYIGISAARRPTVTCRNLAADLREATGVQLSIETIRKRLLEDGTVSRRLLRRVPLTREDKRARLEWARQHVNWGEEWRSVFFTDESRVSRFSDDRRVRVWTRRRVKRHRRTVQEVYPYKGGSVMVWGGILFAGRSDLYICERTMTAPEYVNNIINNIVVNFHAAVGEDFLFFDDNARPHRAAIVTQALETHGIQCLQPPARSPDLNPIEHAWDMFKRLLRDHSPQPETFAQLKDLLPELWASIPQEYFQTLIDSMPRRCQAVIEAHGGYTSY